MSCSRCLSLSALLASTFIMPTAAMDLTSAPLNGFPTHTHTYTPVPEPASLANSYKTAAVCFLGFGECGKDQSFSKGDSSYERNPSDMCREEGYVVTSCSLPKYPSEQCPYDPSLYQSCKDDTRAHVKKQVSTQAAVPAISKTVRKFVRITALITSANAIPATAMPTRRRRQPPTDMLPTAAATAAARPNTNAKQSLHRLPDLRMRRSNRHTDLQKRLSYKISGLQTLLRKQMFTNIMS